MPQKIVVYRSAYSPFDVPRTQVASSDAATHLRQHTEQILRTWTMLTRRQATHAQATADISFLRDSLPLLLKNLANALENPHWNYGAARNNEIARYHGHQRQKAHIYTVAEMVDEYAIFRHVVCESMQQKQPWPPEIIARIHAFIDAAIRTAAHEFAHLEKKQEVQTVEQQRDDSDRRAAAAQVELEEAHEQRNSAHGERDASRGDVALLLQEKQVRERVVALLSHDLRSPLSSIMISAQRLEKKPGDAALVKSAAPRIIRAANRIDSMIQDMLDASRLRAGRGMPLTLTACDLARVAADALEDLALSHSTRIKMHAPKEVRGSWDAGALRRVIDNLVNNALKYGIHGTDIVIDVVDLSEKVRLAVHNQGNPLTASDIERLFDPYVRTKAAESGAQRGWGLGLTLVRGVVQAHGGEVGASSSADAGTTFWFELPKTPPSGSSAT